MSINKTEDMKNKLLELQEEDYSSFVKALVSIETGVNEEEKLNTVYTEFINDDEWYPLDSKFYEFDWEKKR